MKLQEIYTDEHGVVRFKSNEVVRFLLEEGREGRRADLNRIWGMGFPDEDLRQFYQLIGYSIAGYGEIFPETPELDAFTLRAEDGPRVPPEAGDIWADATGCRWTFDGNMRDDFIGGAWADDAFGKRESFRKEDFRLRLTFLRRGSR